MYDSLALFSLATLPLFHFSLVAFPRVKDAFEGPPIKPLQNTMATPADLACVYAALALADDEVEITVRLPFWGGGGP